MHAQPLTQQPARRAADLPAQPYSAAQMTRAALHALTLGCALVPVEYSGKRPLGRAWNDPTHLITTPEAAARRWASPANIGVHLGASGLVSLDVDDLDLSRAELAALGVDLDALLSAHPHPIRGRGVRLWFLAAADDPIRATRQLQVGGRTAFELRAGPGAQDVAPGSLHPSGIVYRWAKTAPQRREDLPALPDELRRVYAVLGGRTLKRDDVAPPAPRPQPARRPGSGTRPSVGESVIDAFNARVTVADVLARNGYREAGGRWISPNSSTRQPGVTVYDDGERQRAYSHHGSDSWAGRAEDAFGLLTALEHGDDLRAALRGARAELGLTTAPRAQVGQEAPLTAAQAVRLWAEHGDDLLTRVSDHLSGLEIHHNARAALLGLLSHVYGTAGEHLTPWRDGAFMLPVGGLKAFAALIGGHPNSVRARLETAADLGLIGWAPVDPAQPDRGRVITLAADPRTVTPKGGRAVLRPATRAVRDAECVTVTPQKQPGKEGGDGNAKRRPARHNPLRDLLPLALILSRHRGLSVPDLAARLKTRADSVRRKLAQLDGLGYLRPDGGLRVPFRQFWADMRAVGADVARDRLTGVLQRQAAWAAHALTTCAAADPQERARLGRLLRTAQGRLERLADGEAPHAVMMPTPPAQVRA